MIPPEVMKQRVQGSTEVNSKYIQRNNNDKETKVARHQSMRQELLLSPIGYVRHMEWLRE
ncbi:hypothetical protein SAMN05216341_1344 [Leuconostocaceae bacterium R-53105]|uniref:Uncharacterized protein n=1 Tax=Convivina intestini TaxID=1505726 RepID=A0A2U1D4G0_9LACO|nr:hypothetical protein C7384_11230 [Convivina intestini]SDC25496.1 hypothetical protein SAMN05216341_1344 [Leuconostocaceae bacterium R-53105]